MSTKTIKVALEYVDKDNVLNYEDICKELFDLQYKTYTACNKAMTYLYTKDAQGFIQVDIGLPKVSEKDLYGKSFHAYLENKMNEIMEGCLSNNVAQTRQFVCNRYKNDKKKGLLKGEVSLTRFKREMPLILHNVSYSLLKSDKGILVDVGLFNLPKQKQLGVKRIKFLIRKLGKSEKAIFERIMDKSYKKGSGQISYDKKNKKWMLAISYSFEVDDVKEKDSDIIMGVDLGIANTAVIALLDNKKKEYIYLDNNKAFIDGHEIIQYRQKHDARKRSEYRATKWASENNTGKGRRARMEKAYKNSDKYSRFRETYNHKVSKYIVDLAIKNNVSLIQMENLAGIDKKDKFLKNWSYYDLQNKIGYKAELAGILVKTISPEFTSQRCNECGHIEKANRVTRDIFICKKCKHITNADKNASRNIAMPEIENIIGEYKKKIKDKVL